MKDKTQKRLLPTLSAAMSIDTAVEKSALIQPLCVSCYTEESLWQLTYGHFEVSCIATVPLPWELAT